MNLYYLPIYPYLTITSLTCAVSGNYSRLPADDTRQQCIEITLKHIFLTLRIIQYQVLCINTVFNIKSQILSSILCGALIDSVIG